MVKSHSPEAGNNDSYLERRWLIYAYIHDEFSFVLYDMDMAHNVLINQQEAHCNA